MSDNRTYASRRLASLGSYAFAEVDQEVAKLRARGIEPIDFGVGDPTVPTPEIVRRATARGIEERRSAGYPSYIGDAAFRTAKSPPRSAPRRRCSTSTKHSWIPATWCCARRPATRPTAAARCSRRASRTTCR